MLKIAAVALCLALACLTVSSTANALHTRQKQLSPVVTVPGLGQLVGLDSENAPGIFSFKNVPFAAPPVGQLRFADTVPAAPWAGVRNATTFGPGCPTIYSAEAFPRSWMRPTTLDEDCLYLNVYTPSLAASASGKLLPVVVFFYGGNYDLGSAAVPLYDGSDMAHQQNVVVVTVNYRLNVLAGLSTGSITGNYHIKDQRMSLVWCQKYIGAFGGDANRVTIFGQSAGGSSVTAHMIAPGSWPYFKSALALSNPLGLVFTTPAIAQKLAGAVLRNVSCPNDGSEQMVACLRRLPWQQLVAIGLDKKALVADLLPRDAAMVLMPWLPTIDGTTIPMQAITALSTGNYHKVPFIISTVANESNEFTRDVVQGNLSALETDLLMDVIFWNKTLSHAVKTFYGPIPPFAKDDHLWLDPIVTDWLWWAPWTLVGQAMSQTFGSVWQVMFTFYCRAWNKWTYKKQNWYCDWAPPGYLKPVCHADDLAFYFFPLTAIKNAGYSVPADITPTAGERQLSLAMQRMLANLARSGNPGAQYPPLQPAGQPARFWNFTVEDPNSGYVVTNYRAKEVAFWSKEGLIHY